MTMSELTSPRTQTNDHSRLADSALALALAQLRASFFFFFRGGLWGLKPVGLLADLTYTKLHASITKGS